MRRRGSRRRKLVEGNRFITRDAATRGCREGWDEEGDVSRGETERNGGDCTRFRGTNNSMDAACLPYLPLSPSPPFFAYAHTLYIIRPPALLPFPRPALVLFILPRAARGRGERSRDTPQYLPPYLRHTAANRTEPCRVLSISLSLSTSLLHRVFCTVISCAPAQWFSERPYSRRTIDRSIDRPIGGE